MAGRGVGAAERSRAGPQPGPRPRASSAARSGLGGPCCPLHPALGRSPLSSPRSPAGRAGAPETPSGGSRLVVGRWSGPGGDLLACPRPATPVAASGCTFCSGTTTTGSWRRSCGARMQKPWIHGVGHYCTLRFLWDIWNLLESCCDIKQT